MRRTWVVVSVMSVLVSCAQRSDEASAESPAETAGAEEDIRPIEEPPPEMLAAAAPEADAPPMRLTFLDTGQGDCALIECPNGRNIMIDCGKTAWGNSSLEHVQATFDELVAEGEVIDVLVLTHPDQDHYNLIEDVVGERPIVRAIHSRELSDYAVGGFNDWLTAHSSGVEGETTEIIALDGEIHEDGPSDLFGCGDVSIQILAANVPARPPNANDAGWISNGASIVLRVERGAFSAILTGDATFDTERAMMEHYANRPDVLDAFILRLGHHGTSVTSSSPEWLAAVTPEIAIVSAGHHGSFRHPRCSVIERVMELESTVPDDARRHVVTCGVGSGEPRPDDCPAGAWCVLNTSEPAYDTYSSGNLTLEIDVALSLYIERAYTPVP